MRVEEDANTNRLAQMSIRLTVVSPILKFVDQTSDDNSRLFGIIQDNSDKSGMRSFEVKTVLEYLLISTVKQKDES